MDQFAESELLSNIRCREDGAPVQRRGRRGDLIQKLARDPVAELDVVMVVSVAVEIQQEGHTAGL